MYAREQLGKVLVNPSSNIIRDEAEILRLRAQQIIEDSIKQAKDENTLLDELSQLENDISKLIKETRQKFPNPSRSIVNVQRLKQLIGNEVVDKVLLERGLDGLEVLQRASQEININDFKSLIDNLGANELINILKTYDYIFVNLLIEIAQKAQESGIINNRQRLETIIRILKNITEPQKIEEELSVIKQAQRSKVQEQITKESEARSKYKLYSSRPPEQRNYSVEIDLLQQARNERTKLTELEKTKQIIFANSSRIETSLNPQQWANLPCFSGDTLVWTANGKKRIDNLKVGETVLSFDFTKRKVSKQKVTHVLKNKTIHFYKIKVGSSFIHATGSHLFWVEDELAWIAARNLKEGMRLKLLNGRFTSIKSVLLLECLETETYNLSINLNHNYFIGSGILVHNEGPVNYDLGGKYKIYIGTNEKFSQKIYIGITDQTLKDREQGHRSEARREIKKLQSIPQELRTSQEEANLKFYEFKQGMKLGSQPIAEGIKEKYMAEYIEENTVRFYERQGQKEIMNRGQRRITDATMSRWAVQIAQDKNIQAKKYCT